MVKPTAAALLLAGIAAASPLPTAQPSNTVVIFNNCEQPIYSWGRVTYEGSQDERKGVASGAAVAKGLTILDPDSTVGYSLGIHVSTSKNSYADHNTKDFVYGLEFSRQSLTTHVNLLDVYGKAKWLAAVAAASAVQCSGSGGQSWSHFGDKHFEGKGVVECRGNGNEITAAAAAVAYGLCANPKEFKFNEQGELMYQGKALGYNFA